MGRLGLRRSPYRRRQQPEFRICLEIGGRERSAAGMQHDRGLRSHQLQARRQSPGARNGGVAAADPGADRLYAPRIGDGLPALLNQDDFAKTNTRGRPVWRPLSLARNPNVVTCKETRHVRKDHVFAVRPMPRAARRFFNRPRPQGHDCPIWISASCSAAGKAGWQPARSQSPLLRR